MENHGDRKWDQIETERITFIVDSASSWTGDSPLWHAQEGGNCTAARAPLDKVNNSLSSDRLFVEVEESTRRNRGTMKNHVSDLLVELN